MSYRKPGSEARQVRELAFDRLPPVVRDRLALSLASGGAPEPLLADASRRAPLSAARWRALAAVAAIAEAVLWFEGFGDARSPFALQPLAFAFAHGAAIFALLFSLIRAARIARGRSGAPVPEGRYLFPLDLVEASGTRLRLTDLHTLRRVEARPGKRGPAVVLVFADAHEVTFEAQPEAEALALRVWAAVRAASALILPDDQPRVERLDPFFELRVADDWASADVHAQGQGSRFVRAPLPALAGALAVVSALAGLGLFALRNRLSDDEMFAQAIEIAVETQPEDRYKVGPYAGVRHVDELDAVRLDRVRGDEDKLQEYLRHPGARKAEAEAALFEIWKSNPARLRAEIRRGGARAEQAAETLFDIQRGDLDALADYIRRRGPYADRADEQLFALAQQSGAPRSYRFYLKHGKRHADEVQSKLLPEAAYLEAHRGTDVEMLDEFIREYPDSAHIEEIKAKVHDLYAGALAAYRARNPSEASLRFVTALLAELEDRADPSVTLAVGVDDTETLAEDDVRLGARLGVDYLPATPYFTGPKLSAFTEQIRADFEERLRSSFPNGTVVPRGVDYNASGGGRPLFTVTCAPVALLALVSQRDQLKVADVRFRAAFRAAVPARAQEITWRMTTPGAQGFDITVKADRVVVGQVDRGDLAAASYERLRNAGATQILQRIQLDF